MEKTEVELPEGFTPAESLDQPNRALDPEGQPAQVVVRTDEIDVPEPTLPMRTDPFELLEKAMDKLRDPDQLKMFMDLAERHDKEVARKEFVAAMAGFRAEAIEIRKTRKVDFTSRRTGERTHYSHAELGDIIEAAVPALSAWGLSHRWETEQKDNGEVYVTCFLTHVGGHSESASLHSPPDTSGSKNPIQAIGSTTTYLQRYTFMAVTGLAARGSDDDGAGSVPYDTLSEEQQVNLLAVAEEEFGADRNKALESLAFRYFHIETRDWTAIPAYRYDDAVRQLREFNGAQSQQ